MGNVVRENFTDVDAVVRYTASQNNFRIGDEVFNIWLYEPNDTVFAGVELNDPPTRDLGQEQKSVTLKKYACYKHVGPYHKIKETGQAMRYELENRGLEAILPYVGVYGHWTGDETKLETELYMSLK